MIPSQSSTRPSSVTAMSARTLSSNPSKSPIPFARIMTPVEWKHLHFIIMDCPTSNTLPFYAQQLSELGVSDVVRVCEPTYDKSYLVSRGIRVHDWAFTDGAIPPTNILQQFLALCDDRFEGLCQGGSATNKSIIAVHCVAGLGRAPVLVACALVESGMTPLDTVEFIRKRRRGALNSVQLNWLVDKYRRQYRKGKPSFSVSSSALAGSIPGNSTTNANNHSGTSTPVPLDAQKSGFKESFGRMFKLGKAKSNDGSEPSQLSAG